MKKLITIFMIIIVTLSTTSCKGTKQEMDHLSIVLATGFDLTPENKYLLSFQILNTKKQPSIKKGTKHNQQVSSDVLSYSMEGDTPREAITKLSTEIGRNLFFGQSKYIVVSEDLAQFGLSFFADTVLRLPEARPNSLLLVTKGKASDIIEASTTSDTIPGNNVEALKKQQSLNGYAPIVSRLDFANSLSKKTVSPVVGVIDLDKSAADSTFKMAGTAVFKKDKLIGYLDINETQGMQWIKGKIRNTTLSVPLYENGFITFDVIKVKSKVKARIIDNTITIYITVKERGNILEMSDSINVMKNPGAMFELSRLKEAGIESKIKASLYAAQKKLNADIFDFGGLVHKTYPNYWKTIEDNWDEIFPNIEVKINVDSRLKRPGIINEPIR